MLLHRYADSNVAGFVWSYSFFINPDERSATYTLSVVYEGDDDPPQCPPAETIVDGVDLHERFSAMLEQLGVDESFVSRERVGEALAAISPDLASEFLGAAESLEARADAKREADIEHRKLVLEPFRNVIDSYVTSTPDTSTRGGGYQVSHRRVLTLFIEEYVLAHGLLPTGTHRIKLATGGFHYSGGLHDFTALPFASGAQIP
jgi:hypothetical protein